MGRMAGQGRGGCRDYLGKLQTFDAPGPSRCFALVPNTRPHHYLLTHRSVAFVACSVCGSAVKEPCKIGGDYKAEPHAARRADYAVLCNERPSTRVAAMDDPKKG